MRFLALVAALLAAACSTSSFPGDGAGAKRGVDADGDGVSAIDGDCNDTPGAGAAINPGATELCDGVDNDCDDATDDNDSNVRAFKWYFDQDGDDFPQNYAEIERCDPTTISDESSMAEVFDAADGVVDGTDADPDVDILRARWKQPGYDANGDPIFDCDDSLLTGAQSQPGGTETCDDLDNDCNGTVDDGAGAPGRWFADADGDTYGDPAAGVTSCVQFLGTVADSTDCDDSVEGGAAIHPGADELCATAGTDNDCDGDSAEFSDGTTWYYDGDVDGHGDADMSTYECAMPMEFTWSLVGDDCDDGEARAYPGATETCDGVDNNCVGGTDVDAVDMTLWYFDQDGDTWGDGTTATACSAPSARWSSRGGDCDDADVRAFPGNPEVADGIDNDCNELRDDGLDCAAFFTFLDDDGDRAILGFLIRVTTEDMDGDGDREEMAWQAVDVMTPPAGFTVDEYLVPGAGYYELTWDYCPADGDRIEFDVMIDTDGDGVDNKSYCAQPDGFMSGVNAELYTGIPEEQWMERRRDLDMDGDGYIDDEDDCVQEFLPVSPL